MNIQAKGYTIEMDFKELWDLAFSVKNSLECNLKNHWVNHQEVWKKHEQKKLNLLETMFTALGCLYIYDNIFKEADKIFENFNSKKNHKL